MKKLQSKLKKTSGSIEVEIIEAEGRDMEESHAGYEKVPSEEKDQHQEFMGECMASVDEHVDTEGLDESRAYMACAIGYDKKFKTAYAPCVPGVGCVY